METIPSSNSPRTKTHEAISAAIANVEIFDHHDDRTDVCVIDSVDVSADITVGDTTERIYFQDDENGVYHIAFEATDQDAQIASLAAAIRTRDGLVEDEDAKGYQDDLDLFNERLGKTTIIEEIGAAARKAKNAARASIEPDEDEIEVLVAPRVQLGGSMYRLIQSGDEFIVQEQVSGVWESVKMVSEETADDIQERFQVPGDDFWALIHAPSKEAQEKKHAKKEDGYKITAIHSDYSAGNIGNIDVVSVIADITVGDTTAALIFQADDELDFTTACHNDYHGQIAELATALRTRQGIPASDETELSDDVEVLNKYLKSSGILEEIDSAGWDDCITAEKAHWNTQTELVVEQAIAIAATAEPNAQILITCFDDKSLDASEIRRGEPTAEGEVERLDCHLLQPPLSLTSHSTEYATNAVKFGLSKIKGVLVDKVAEPSFKITEVVVHPVEPGAEENLDVRADIKVGEKQENLLFQNVAGEMVVSDGLGHNQDDELAALAFAIRERDNLAINEDFERSVNLELVTKHLSDTGILDEIDDVAYAAKRAADENQAVEPVQQEAPLLP